MSNSWEPDRNGWSLNVRLFVWSISDFPCSLTRNITSHSMKNLAFHSLLRWKMIILPVLTILILHLSLKGWENVLFWTWELWKGQSYRENQVAWSFKRKAERPVAVTKDAFPVPSRLHCKHVPSIFRFSATWELGQMRSPQFSRGRKSTGNACSLVTHWSPG